MNKSICIYCGLIIIDGQICHQSDPILICSESLNKLHYFQPIKDCVTANHPLNFNTVAPERVGPMINETISHEQEEHLALLKRDFCTLVDTKYRKGCIEHKTLLTDLSIEKLIDEGIAEAIDQFNYLHTLRANYKKLQSLLK